ncbi:MAG: hypothetical protein KF916_04215 [Microbacteriaceae bacterium]|nr:hypothetical protein [Microbacteriaceae bacterium]
MLDYDVQIAVNIAELQAAENALKIAVDSANQAVHFAQLSSIETQGQGLNRLATVSEVNQIALELAILRQGIDQVITDYVVADFNIADKWQNLILGKYAALGLTRFLNMLGILEEGRVEIFRNTRFESVNPRSLNQLAERIPTGDAQVRIEKYSGVENSDLAGSGAQQGPENTYIVYISGTREWGIDSKDAFDLTSNLALAGDKYSGSLQGVDKAMFQAGITAEDSVILVGYSQGGMVASALVAMQKYRVSHLVTFGSPAMPVTTSNTPKIISVTHREDFVPKVLGPSPQDGRVIVSADSAPDISAHDLHEYRKTARKIDFSPSSEIVELQNALRNLTEKAETSTWHITRSN